MDHAGIARPRPLIVAHLLLLLSEEPRHGYELAESLRTSEFDGISTSLIYRELARLEEDGLVRSFWQASQARGPARHMYELTPAGRADLIACADDVRGLIRHLNEFLSRFGGVKGDGNKTPVAPPPVEPDPVKARPGFWKLRQRSTSQQMGPRRGRVSTPARSRRRSRAPCSASARTVSVTAVARTTGAAR